MPLIARVSESVQLQPSAPVQIAATSDARINGEALAKFGDAVTKFGEEQLHVDRTLKREEFKNELQNVVKLSGESAQQSAAPDGSNLGDEFDKRAVPATAELLNRYGGYDPQLRGELESYTKRVRNDVDTSLMIQKSQMLEKHNFDRMESVIKSSANRLRENMPLTDSSVVNSVRAELSSTFNMIDTVSAKNPENVVKMREAALGMMAKEFAEGFEGQQRYGELRHYLRGTQADPGVFTEFSPQEARALGYVTGVEADALAAKGENFKVPLETDKKGKKIDPSISFLLGGLTPAQRGSLIEKMDAKIKEQAQVRAGDVSASLSGYEKHRARGGEVTQAETQKLVDDIRSLPGAPQQAKQRLIDRVRTADAIGEQMKVAATTPRSELQGLLSKATAQIESVPASADGGRDFAIMENRAQAVQSLQQSMAAMIKEQDEDPAGFMLRNDKEVALIARGTKDGTGVESFTTTLMNKQRYMGMTPMPVTKQQANGIAQQMAGNPDPGFTNEYLNSLQAQYGKHFPAVMNQVAENNKTLAPLQAVVYAPPETRAAAVDAVKAAPQMKIEYAKAENQVLKKDIEDQTKSAMTNFRTAVMGGTNDTSRLGVVQSMGSLIELQAQRDVLKGAEPKEAVQKAYRDIVATNYAVVTGGNSSVLVPRQLVPEPKIVETFLRVYEPARGYGTRGIYDTQADPHTPGATVTVKVDTASNTNKDLMNDFQIAGDKAGLRNMRWVTNDAQTGVRLMEVMTDGTLQPVYNKLKQKVETSYDQINNTRNKKLIEANKTVLQKLFGN